MTWGQRFGVYVIAAWLAAVVPAWAQLSTAELNGRVTDASGGIPAAPRPR